MPQPVRHFRQILIWPLQVMPIREGAQIQEPWDILAELAERAFVARARGRVRLQARKISRNGTTANS